MNPKPPARVRDKDLLRRLHLEWRSCALCWSIGFDSSFNQIGLSLHHVSKHPRDDLRENLVMLCGHGTAGCHGAIEAHNVGKSQELMEFILENRPDTVLYLEDRFGDGKAQLDWILG